MKADFREFTNGNGDGSFSIELTPESTEEILRLARLGLTSAKGRRSASIYFGEHSSTLRLNFPKHRNKYPSIEV